MISSLSWLHIHGELFFWWSPRTSTGATFQWCASRSHGDPRDDWMILQVGWNLHWDCSILWNDLNPYFNEHFSKNWWNDGKNDINITIFDVLIMILVQLEQFRRESLELEVFLSRCLQQRLCLRPQSWDTWLLEEMVNFEGNWQHVFPFKAQTEGLESLEKALYQEAPNHFRFLEGVNPIWCTMVTMESRLRDGSWLLTQPTFNTNDSGPTAVWCHDTFQCHFFKKCSKPRNHHKTPCPITFKDKYLFPNKKKNQNKKQPQVEDSGRILFLA